MLGVKMDIKKLFHDAFALLIGNLLLAFGVAYFIIPNNILSGGVAGLAIAISPLIHIEVDTLILIIIGLTFVMGILFLGKEFALKTLTSSILYPVLLKVMGAFEYQVPVDPLLASLYGGLIMGAGIGLVFRAGASTGGMDIPPLILEKYSKIKVHIWIMIIDGLTILLGMATFGLNNVLIGLISAYAMSKSMSAVQTLGGQQAKQVFIITDKIDEVLEMILTTLDRGATLIEGRGGYTNQEKQLIMTVLMTKQYAQLEKTVKEVDENAFLIVSDVTEVHGDGFYDL